MVYATGIGCFGPAGLFLHSFEMFMDVMVFQSIGAIVPFVAVGASLGRLLARSKDKAKRKGIEMVVCRQDAFAGNVQRFEPKSIWLCD